LLLQLLLQPPASKLSERTYKLGMHSVLLLILVSVAAGAAAFAAPVLIPSLMYCLFLNAV